MEHLSEKDLILFYYKELSNKEAASVEGHLSSCPACRKRGEEVKSFLAGFSFEEVTLEKDKLNQMVACSRQVGPLANFSEALAAFFLNPRVALAAVFLFFFIFTFNSYHHKRLQFSEALFDISIDLVSEDEFEIFLDSYNLREKT